MYEAGGKALLLISSAWQIRCSPIRAKTSDASTTRPAPGGRRSLTTGYQVIVAPPPTTQYTCHNLLVEDLRSGHPAKRYRLYRILPGE
ncbi:hypothetical protein PGTUg99_000208 [Puccinia graminis f. sp. tritici]|uniref:Uncharacterized protein n=1 Tax=Puccinia graminis f. sp. tritici TaxID=56615 RepID=A0A5B0SJL2_PUCGR|nr:hypothetical protein PGTUg99_000208 [Puccinia graminis f. sp. tritici]